MFSESASAQAALAYNPAEEQQIAASEMAQAQLQLTRIRAIRAEFMAEVDLASGDLKTCGAWRPWTAMGWLATTTRRLVAKLRPLGLGGLRKIESVGRTGTSGWRIFAKTIPSMSASPTCKVLTERPNSHLNRRRHWCWPRG
jgi:hypothetical protein